jgi:hypothetical protein
MRKLLAVVCGCALLLGLSSPARAQTILNFEDLTTPGEVPIPVGYGGLDWSNMFYVNASIPTLNPSGYRNGRVSGDVVAFNGGGAGAAVTASAGSGPFDFYSAYLTAAWNDGLDFVARGFRGGTEVFTQALVLNTSGPTHAIFDFTDVDRVTFETSGGVDNPVMLGGGTHFAMDDVQLGAPIDSTVTPEPISLVLLGTGLAGVGVVSRRRRVRRAEDLA